MSVEINFQELIAQAVSALKLNADEIAGARDKIKKYLVDNKLIAPKQVSAVRVEVENYLKALNPEEPKIKKNKTVKKDIENPSSSQKNSSDDDDKEDSPLKLTSSKNKLQDGNLLIKCNIFANIGEAVKNNLVFSNIDSTKGLLAFLTPEEINEYIDLYNAAIAEELEAHIDALINEYPDDELSGEKAIVRQLKSGNFELTIGKKSKELTAEECPKLTELVNYCDELKFTENNESYIKYLQSDIVKSYNVIHPSILSKVVQTSKTPVKFKYLEYMDEDGAHFNEKKLAEVINCNKHDSLYYALFLSLRNFTSSDFGNVVKNVFKYRLGIINRFSSVPKEFSLEKLWNKAYSNIKSLYEDDDFKEKFEGSKNKNKILNEMKCWINILESKYAFEVIMKGARGSKWFEKYLLELASSKVSLRLFIGALYPISFIFTPFMLWYENVEIKKTDSLKTILNKFQNDNATDIAELNWVYYLKHPKSETNEMVKILEKVLVTFEVDDEKTKVKREAPKGFGRKKTIVEKSEVKKDSDDKDEDDKKSEAKKQIVKKELIKKSNDHTGEAKDDVVKKSDAKKQIVKKELTKKSSDTDEDTKQKKVDLTKSQNSKDSKKVIDKPKDFSKSQNGKTPTSKKSNIKDDIEFDDVQESNLDDNELLNATNDDDEFGENNIDDNDEDYDADN